MGDQAVFWSREELEGEGFRGFVSFVDLRSVEVPAVPGVYLVTWAGPAVPRFLPRSPAGSRKGRDPSVSISVLEGCWVDGASVLYIGKASGGSTGRRGVEKRLDEFRRHGLGQPVGHWGGRYIWQLEQPDRLLVSWKITDGEDDPEDVESALLARFERDYAALPFANRKRGRRLVGSKDHRPSDPYLDHLSGCVVLDGPQV